MENTIRNWYWILILLIGIPMISCHNNKLAYKKPDSRILFLHHSTGMNVWLGEKNGLTKLSERFGPSMVARLLKDYNKSTGKKYSIERKYFPINPYPWANYPFDYYNIWVKNEGNKLFMNNPTLEMLVPQYDIIIFKHCFPFSNILPDDSVPDIDSSKRTIANYKLQYEALKNKLKEYPDTKFIIWTGAALTEKSTNYEEAERAREFIAWMTTIWDEPDDNLYIFDFRKIETEGGLYLKPEYAVSEFDSHPNEILAEKAAKSFVERIIEVVENSN
jgi:hypothetical protein